jgi:hypothetical protein
LQFLAQKMLSTFRACNKAFEDEVRRPAAISTRL